MCLIAYILSIITGSSAVILNFTCSKTFTKMIHHLAVCKGSAITFWYVVIGWFPVMPSAVLPDTTAQVRLYSSQTASLIVNVTLAASAVSVCSSTVAALTQSILH